MKTIFKHLALILLLAMLATPARAATRTFVGDGASHNWSSTGAWVEGAVPTAADDVVFSSNAAGSILVVDGNSGSPSLARSIDTTGYTRTITFTNTHQLNIGDPAGSGAGSFKATAGFTFSIGSSSLLKFVSTTGTTNFTSGGYTYGNITFDGVGGTWVLQDSLNCNSDLMTLTNGTFNTNGQTLTTCPFSSSNSNTRALTLGATSWNVSTLTPWDISTSTGMTLSAASSTLTMPTTSSSVSFNGGGLTYGTLSATALTIATITITGANTFGTLTLGNGATPTGSFVLAANQTVTGTLTATGNSAVNRLFIRSNTKGTPRTISAGTVTVSKIDLEDIVGAGAGSWNIASVTGGAGDCGGNSGITFTTPITAYMKTAVSVNWSAANWYTTSGGATPITNSIPLCQDTARFDSASVTVGSKTITMDTNSPPRFPAMDWTGVANTPALAMGANTASLFGSLTFVSGMSLSGTAGVTLEGRGSQTITTGGINWTEEITLNAPGGTWTLGDNLTTTSSLSPALTMTAGTLATGSHTLAFSNSSTPITATGGTLSIGSGGSVTIGSAAISAAGGSSGGSCTFGANDNWPFRRAASL